MSDVTQEPPLSDPHSFFWRRVASAAVPILLLGLIGLFGYQHCGQSGMGPMLSPSELKGTPPTKRPNLKAPIPGEIIFKSKGGLSLNSLKALQKLGSIKSLRSKVRQRRRQSTRTKTKNRRNKGRIKWQKNPFMSGFMRSIRDLLLKIRPRVKLPDTLQSMV